MANTTELFSTEERFLVSIFYQSLIYIGLSNHGTLQENRQIGRQIDRQTDRHAGRQTEELSHDFGSDRLYLSHRNTTQIPQSFSSVVLYTDTLYGYIGYSLSLGLFGGSNATLVSGRILFIQFIDLIGSSPKAAFGFLISHKVEINFGLHLFIKVRNNLRLRE